MNEMALEHHGIKGQKWGVRRFQNADGSLTNAGRKRYSSEESKRTGLSDSQKSALKTAGKAALIAGAAVAVGYGYSKNKAVCDVALKTIGNVAAYRIQAKAAVGKKVVGQIAKTAYQQAKQGVIDGAKNAPYKVAKAAAEGAAIIATKKFLESTLGKDTMDSYIKAYNAYNKKNKVGQVNLFGKKKDDEDDDE